MSTSSISVNRVRVRLGAAAELDVLTDDALFSNMFSNAYPGLEVACLVAEHIKDDSAVIVGGAMVKIYRNAEDERSEQCHPGQNAWIEHVLSKQRGAGRALVDASLDWFKARFELLGRKNVYVGPCRDAEGFWARCGFSKLVDDRAEPHEVACLIRDDWVTIGVSAENEVVSYASGLGIKYEADAELWRELLSRVDCGILMGVPLLSEFDNEVVASAKK